jgi:hypothetical protein
VETERKSKETWIMVTDEKGKREREIGREKERKKERE